MRAIAIAFTLALVSFESSAQEQKAAKAKPFTEADRAAHRARVKKMDFWAVCSELGRVLRRPDISPRGEHWEFVVLAQTQTPAADHGFIRDRRLRVGMDECSVVAILGKPDALNRTNSARGRSDQLVYRAKGMYVYTENGLVRAWQE